jgi:PBSX family phage portal protein
MSNDKQQYDLKIREIELPQKVQEVIRKNIDTNGTKTPAEDPFYQFYDRKIIEPPHDLYLLSTLTEYSTILNPCVDAMTVNISGLGYRIVPRDEKESIDVPNEIKNDIAKLKTFYETAYLEGTYTQLRKLLRKDLEFTGNSYTEILPARGDHMIPVGMNHIQSWKMRVCVADTEYTTYELPRVIKNESGIWEIKWIQNRKQFRRFAHITQYSNHVTYFKEWGDPRVISSKTGDPLAESWESATPEQRAEAANPVIHQKIYCPRSPYGLPRYIGNILTMNGCRAAEEVNYITLKCNNMPAMMLLVTNAAITNASVDRIREFIEHRVQGDQNYSTILVVEAEPISEGMKDPGTMKMDLNPLTEHQHTDSMFTQYMEGCEERVRQAYRLPPILIGRCVPIETEFLTENGWKFYNEISNDEKLASFNEENEEIEYDIPLDRYEYDYKGDMYQIKDEYGYINFECTPYHKMLYQLEEDGWKKDEIQDLVKYLKDTNGEGELCLPVPCEHYYCKNDCTSGELDDYYCEWIDSSFISTYEYDGKICCFTTKNGTIITRNNECMLVSGNSDDYTRSCYSEDTETLTENGWKYHWEIGENEKIAAFDYEDEEIVYVVPTYKHLSYVEDGEMIHVENHSTDFLVTPEHTLMINDNEKYEDFIIEASTLENVLWTNEGFSVYTIDFEPATVHENDYLVYDTNITYENITIEKYTGNVYCYSVPEYGYFVTRRNGKVALQGNTADSSKKVAEEQVFAPERGDEDAIQNIKIVPYLGIAHATIKSNTPDVTDNYELTQLLAVAERSGGLSPYISRFIVEDVLGRDLPEIDTTIPDNIPFTLTMLREQLNAQAELQNATLDSDKETVDQLKSIKNLMEQQKVGTEEYYRRMDRVIKLMEITQPEIPKVQFKPSSSKNEIVKSTSIVRKAGEERVVVGAVLVPGQTDLQGELYDGDVVTKAAHYWLEKYQEDRQENGLKLMHSGKVLATLKPYESYVLDEDKTFKVDIGIADGEHPVKKITEITYPKGTWIMMSKIYDDGIWEGIKKGDYLGYSIGGMASVMEIKSLLCV